MTDPTKILPKLRFPEFKNDGEWKVVKLGEIFKRITDKNKENNNNVLTISAQDGLVSQYDYFNKNVAANDVTGYYLIKTGDFAYNKSRSQGYPYGAIKPLKLYDKGVVSTLYICFRTKEQNSCIDFYEHYFETDLIHNEIGKIAQEGARNHGLLNISTEDFFEKISLFIPSLPEQQKIASFLTLLDEQISAHTKKLEALKAHKKSLMQQLFPANGEKTPKLRFPEFKNAGEWKEVRLGDVTKERNEINKTELALLSIGQDGVYPQSESTKRDVSNKDKTKYKHICPNDIGYNTMRMWQGRSAISYLEGIVSPAYTIVIPQANIVPLFLAIVLKLPETVNEFFKHSQGLVSDTLNCKYKDFVQVQICIPSLPEQQKIASFLSSIDEMIQAQDDKIQKLKTYKNGLMQQMFAK